MIKLQDFARQCGVTDRAIQKHLKTYAAELEGLYQRKGSNGTWLSDEACEILRSKMKTQPVMIYDAESNERLQQLEKENKELLEKLTAAQSVAIRAQEALLEAKGAQVRLEATQARLEAAEKETKILEGFIQDAKAEIRMLTEEKAEEVAKAQREAVEATKRAEKAEEELAAYKALPWYRKIFM